MYMDIDVHSLYDFLKKRAEVECWHDDKQFNACEFSGSNFDDAYYGGMESGEVLLARSLLKQFFNK